VARSNSPALSSDEAPLKEIKSCIIIQYNYQLENEGDVVVDDHVLGGGSGVG